MKRHLLTLSLSLATVMAFSQAPICFVKECQLEIFYAQEFDSLSIEMERGIDAVVECWKTHAMQRPLIRLHSYYIGRYVDHEVLFMLQKFSSIIERRGVPTNAIQFRFVEVTDKEFLEYSAYPNRLIIGCVILLPRE